MTIEEMYNNFKYLEDNYQKIKAEHPELVNAFNLLSAMICMHMPEHDTYAFGFEKDGILKFINETIAVYSYNSEDDLLMVSVRRRPKESC